MKTSNEGDMRSAADPELLQLFISGIKDVAIYMLSPHGNIMSWNSGAERIKGYSAAEVLGQHFSRFYTTEDRNSGVPERALETALRDGKLETEGWRVRKDGQVFLASIVLDTIRDEDGRHIGFAKITRDIDEQRKAERSLRESEERFRLLVQGVTDYAIFMLSPAGIVSNWNAGAQRIKGYSDSDIVGSHFSRFYTAEDRAAGIPLQALATAAREGRFESEGWRVRKDGTRFWASVVIDAIRSENGELLGFGKVTRDMTERRAAANALEKAKEALFQAQKLEAIGKLTGGVAHDFNNLLAVIVSGIDIVAKEVQSPPGVKVVAAMQRSATRGAALIQQLMAFARQQPLRTEKHRLGQLIASFEPVLRRACSEQILLKLHLDPTEWAVLLDAAQFEAALLNLVSNADDAMPDGGSVTITVENVSLHAGEVGELCAGPYVKTSVSDTGSGMSSDVAARAIEPFFTTKPLGKGTGMGLSQVYGLVQQSGGELVIRSEPDRGTTVSLYWPAIRVQEEAAIASLDNFSSDKALVVDDQPEVLETLAEMLRTMGYHVLTAAGAEEAMDILKREPGITVVLSDVVMPGMDGVSLGREARKLLTGVKIILASGFPRDNLQGHREGLDEFDFLMKPFRIAELAKVLRQPPTVSNY